MTASVPRQFEAITPVWLSGRLREASVLTGAAVIDVAVEPIAIGIGFGGQFAGLRLTYDGPARARRR